jgi:hypothetical protein
VVISATSLRPRIDPNNIEEGANLAEIDEALEAYLGADLQALEDAASPGRPLWDGNWKNVRVRRATGEEAKIWKSSLLTAVQAGEQEPGDMDWLVFLVAIRDVC